MRAWVLLAMVWAWVLPAFCGEETVNELPNKTVLLAILARNKAHVLPYFLQCIDKLQYNKKLITVYINTNNNTDETEKILSEWAASKKPEYKEIVFESHEVEALNPTNPHDWTPVRFKVLGAIRNKSMSQAKVYGCDYYFVVDCDNFINPCSLKELVKKDKPIIAPMLRAIPNAQDWYSNFFCDISPNGYYKAHPDYGKILHKEMVGTFEEPVVHCTYLVRTDCIDKLTYVDGTNDYEFVIFSRSARNSNVKQFLCNEQDFGVLLHPPDTSTLHEEAKIMTDWLALQQHPSQGSS
jgi:hypothetical protein